MWVTKSVMGTKGRSFVVLLTTSCQSSPCKDLYGFAASLWSVGVGGLSNKKELRITASTLVVTKSRGRGEDNTSPIVSIPCS